MKKPVSFRIHTESAESLARAGEIFTPNGLIKTPAFIPVGTKATVKSLTPEMVVNTGAQAVLANTYHLYLKPGDERVKRAGGLGAFMRWRGPTFTDSGGFQVFSLGAGLGSSVSKISSGDDEQTLKSEGVDRPSAVTIDEEGVTFRSVHDGSSHRFTPERSVDIQHNLGADIFFAFDECTSPSAPYEYQMEAMKRTHRWAERCVDRHRVSRAADRQALFGVIQGGRFKDLRKESARIISSMEFDGFGIGGSFTKDDIHTAVCWVNEVLPRAKPRHLLGIGEPGDMFRAVEAGVDTFDCVAPTRLARTGSAYTPTGRINLMNARFFDDLLPIDPECSCYTCRSLYTRSYLAHLFRSGEMLASTLVSVHNVQFIVSLVDSMRESIMSGTFKDLKDSFFEQYYGK